MTTTTETFLLGLVIFLLVWGGIVSFGAMRLLRRRRLRQATTPNAHGMGYETITFSARDGTPLVGWWILAPPSTQDEMPSTASTVILCHGSEGSMDHWLPLARVLHQAGFNVFLFDFRAHGRSGGRHTTFGMYERDDLLGAIDVLAERGITRVGVWGVSMGAATALLTAAQMGKPSSIAALIADGSFVYLKRTIARRIHFWGIPHWLGWHIAAWMLVVAGVRTHGRMDQVDPILWSKHIYTPVLYIHGGLDWLTTTAEASLLVAQTPAPHEFWIVPDARHGETATKYPDDYAARIVGWFQRWL